MTCRDGLHPSICLPPIHSKTDIKKRHSTVWFVLNPNCLFPLYFVIYRDCYESRHSIPCMFFHYNCRSSELKNNTWNIRCLEGQMCIRICVRKGNSLGQYWNHHFKKKSMKNECLPQIWSPQQVVFTNTALPSHLGIWAGLGKHFSVRVWLLHVHRLQLDCHTSPGCNEGIEILWKSRI